MHSHTMELMKDALKTSKKSLDIGIGSGYMTLAMSKLMGQPNAVSYGIEHFKGVLKLAKRNI